ncbi:MAG TPA: hypothetical protein VEW48_20595 [Thermoanaerobaculia bacterium]|nr:hypothetical protein [Thermoanaerobaculia bacterium]
MDPTALGALATTAVSLVLPFLGKAGEAFSEKAGEKMFEFLRSRFKKKPAAAEALGALEKTPKDPARQQAVQEHVQELLAEDSAALQQLQELLAEMRDQRGPAVVIHQKAGANSNQIGQAFGNVSFGKD